MAVLSATDIYRLVDRVHQAATNTPVASMPGVAATFVALKESGGDTRNTNSNNSNGSIDRGLWQWNDQAWPDISDAVAFDQVQATQRVYTVTQGFRLDKWQPWIRNSDEGRTLWDEINRTLNNRQRFEQAMDAATVLGRMPQDPDAWRAEFQRLSGGGGGTVDATAAGTAAGYSSGELALMRTWDSDGDGTVDVFVGDRQAEDSMSEEGRDAIKSTIEEQWSDETGLPRPGFLNAVKAALGQPASAVLTDSGASVIKIAVYEQLGGGGRFINLPGITPGALPGDLTTLAESAQGALDAVTPGWVEAIVDFLRRLGNPELWRRIGILAGGAALILAAIVLANRNTIAGVATRGAVA